jgi:methionine aminotransferase
MTFKFLVRFRVQRKLLFSKQPNFYLKKVKISLTIAIVKLINFMIEEKISSKLPDVGTSIFTVMSALANQHQAVNLSQGFPDYPVDRNLLSIVQEVAINGSHQYAPMQGLPALRHGVSGMICKNVGIKLSDAEIAITAGATQAIFTAITSLVRKNDEVVLFAPAYDCYEPAIKVNGGKALIVQLEEPDFKPNWGEVEALMNERTRMIIINTPHNPTGSVWDKEDFIHLQEVVKNTGIIILSDEVYDHISFKEGGHLSVLNFPELRSRSFVVGSFGKVFHITGWKIGYVTAPEILMKEFLKVHQYNVFCVNTQAQQALSLYIERHYHPHSARNFLKSKKDHFRQMITNPRLRLLPCNGTYFQLIDFSGVSNLRDVEFAKELTIQNGLATIPLSVFSPKGAADNYLRLCFAKKDETLVQAAEILNKL